MVDSYTGILHSNLSDQMQNMDKSDQNTMLSDVNQTHI